MSEEAVIAAVAGMIGVIVIIAIAIYVLEVIALWKIFVKAGEEGWKAIIPFYNIYILFKISWDVKFFWFYLGAQVVNIIFTGNDNEFLSGLSALCWLGAYVLLVIMFFFLSKSFGQGVGFTIGLALLQTIFVMILGFGSYQYIGNGYVIYQAEKGGSVASATASTTSTASETVDTTATETVTPEPTVSEQAETKVEDDPMGPSDSNF